MEPQLSNYDLSALGVLARLRGLKSEMAPKFAVLREAKTPGAARKRFERMCKRGVLATSKLPAGSQLFRLSAKGVKMIGAPPSFADPPTQGICYDMIASGACGWRTQEFIFLTRSELDALVEKLSPLSKPLKHHGRFILRAFQAEGTEPKEQRIEWHLHFWLAEFKPAEQLAQRIEVIARQLPKSAPFFEDAKQMGLLGVTVAVPSAGVKTTLDAVTFPLEVSVVVVEELAATVSNSLQI